jgi:hypothetical protein
MAILLKNGAVFLHAPKCGGNWVTNALGKIGCAEKPIYHKHAGWERVAMNDPTPWRKAKCRALAKPLPDDTFYFTFVRHPLSWLESFWRYVGDMRVSGFGDFGKVAQWHPNATLNGLWTPDFNKWVARVETLRPGYATELLYSFAHPRVNFVGKQENLVEDTIEVLKRMNMKFDESAVRLHQAVGTSKTPKPKWDRRVKAMAERYEQAGIKGLGYEN